VLEANGKANEIGEILHPYPSQTLEPISMPLQLYHYVRPGSQCAKIDSAVAAVRMREKKQVWAWVFLGDRL